MEIDPAHESDGSSNGSKEGEIHQMSDCHSGYGLPYAPEDFPKPGDKWGWKVGKRLNISGTFQDRYLYLPDRLYKELKLKGFSSMTLRRDFASKSSVKRFVMEAFPGTDVKAFFDSFTWKVHAGEIEGNNSFLSEHRNATPQFDPAGCKAGNINCSSLLETSKPTHSDTMACDICCNEPLFCRDCCCILCSRTVNSANSDHSFIRCEATIKEGSFCGHICHLECGLRSYMAGTVGGTIGLDAEYYCRRCDARTDLVPHVKNLIRTCESISDTDKLHKIINLCVIILRGSTKMSAKTLMHHVQYASGKLKEGVSHEDIWKLDDMSAVTTGEHSVCETDALEVSNFKEASRRDRSLHRISFTNFDSRLESIKLESRIQKTLSSLKKSQETEYMIADDVLTAQKIRLLDLYEELDKERSKLANCSTSADQSILRGVFMRMDQIKREFNKITAMQAVAKGFGKTSKDVLKEHFGVHAGDK